MHSHSEINTASRLFLEAFILEHNLQKGARFSADLLMLLEKEANEKNPGGNNTQELVEEARRMLKGC